MDLLGTPEPPMNITDKMWNMVFTINSMFTDILFTILLYFTTLRYLTLRYFTLEDSQNYIINRKTTS